ncbi:hypothetical protein [Parahaliea mediterranea]|uniref:hypothetical protein n=1 Tax=Parahaliea mediterranea TaxID=651086 RepID=UPI000E2E45DA|nr:hypothetical protein [Parahaliea mediterranea]
MSTIIGFCLSHAPANANDSPEDKLSAAYARFLDDLAKAERTLVDPEHYPPAASERVLADGYRYLLAHLNREIEFGIRADARFPEFFRSMDMLRKWTGENPDAMYLKAPIDATGYYEVDIQAHDTGEWQNGSRINGQKAPRLATFQTITGVPGYSGELAEMANCQNQTLDFVNSFTLKANANGNYQLLIGPEKPEGYSGNFLYSRKSMTCKGTGQTQVVDATSLSVREVFSDWDNEQPLTLSIRRRDTEGLNRPPMDADNVADLLASLGTRVANQIRFWNLLMAFPMEMTQDSNGDGKRALPVNGINQPAPPFTAGGVAGAQQIYASGIFELEEGQALVIEMETPVEPYYIGFQLNNLWMEGPDQQNYVSSLSGAQNPPIADGRRFYILSGRDPGVQGWVDTTGLTKGFHAMRFVFKQDPSPEQLPRMKTYLVDLDQLQSVLPDNYPTVSKETRRQQVARRQAHIKMRWRNY